MPRPFPGESEGEYMTRSPDLIDYLDEQELPPEEERKFQLWLDEPLLDDPLYL